MRSRNSPCATNKRRNWSSSATSSALRQRKPQRLWGFRCQRQIVGGTLAEPGCLRRLSDLADRIFLQKQALERHRKEKKIALILTIQLAVIREIRATLQESLTSLIGFACRLRTVW